MLLMGTIFSLKCIYILYLFSHNIEQNLNLAMSLWAYVMVHFKIPEENQITSLFVD